MTEFLEFIMNYDLEDEIEEGILDYLNCNSLLKKKRLSDVLYPNIEEILNIPDSIYLDENLEFPKLD